MSTLLRNGFVLPMTGGAVAFDRGSVLVEGDRILAVGPVAEVDVVVGLARDPPARRRRPGPHLVGLEHLFYCSEQCFRDALALAEEFDTGLHTHSSESIWEVQESLKRFGRRPLEVFHQRAILTDRTVVAHCVWLDDREIQLLAQTGTAVAHCPCSNMKLSSGPARIGAMHASGVVIGLGSDGEKENNNLDIVEEMRFASLLHVRRRRRPRRRRARPRAAPHGRLQDTVRLSRMPSW